MRQDSPQAGTSSQAASQPTASRQFEPRRLGQTLGGALFVVLSPVWIVVFSISLAHMPDAEVATSAPEMVVTATYLPSGKSRLGFTTPDGDLQRHQCDPTSRLCRFVVQHSPVELMVRLAGPSSGMTDQAVLFARAGNELLVTPAEGAANLAALKSTYRGGLFASLAGLVIGGLALRRTRL